MDTKRQEKAVATAIAYSQGNIAGLDDAMTRRLIASTVYTESNGGDLGITNRQGYVGRYQAGAGWLADAGYVDQEKLRATMAGFRSEWAWAQSGGMTRFLQDSSNWKDNLNLDTYKQSPELQDQAFKRNSDAAYQRASKNNLLNEGDDLERIAGFLKARHIAGYGGAKGVIEGNSPRSDSNGTSNYDYYNDIARNRDGLDQLMTRVPDRPLMDGPQVPRSSVISENLKAHGLLRNGEHGIKVSHLQASLRQLGYRDDAGREIVIDGDFGDRTEQAVKAFQQAQGLADVDGIAGRRTVEALREAGEAPLLSNAAHPDHAMYRQALRGVQQLPADSFKNDTERSNAAATLVFEARVSGVRQIDHVVLNNNGSGLFAVQGRLDDPAHSRVYVDRAQAAAQPVERSTEQLRQDTASQQQVQRQSQVQIQQQQIEHRGVTVGIRP